MREAEDDLVEVGELELGVEEVCGGVAARQGNLRMQPRRRRRRPRS